MGRQLLPMSPIVILHRDTFCPFRLWSRRAGTSVYKEFHIFSRVRDIAILQHDFGKWTFFCWATSSGEKLESKWSNTRIASSANRKQDLQTCTTICCVILGAQKCTLKIHTRMPSDTFEAVPQKHTLRTWINTNTFFAQIFLNSQICVYKCQKIFETFFCAYLQIVKCVCVHGSPGYTRIWLHLYVELGDSARSRQLHRDLQIHAIC